MQFFKVFHVWVCAFNVYVYVSLHEYVRLSNFMYLMCLAAIGVSPGICGDPGMPPHGARLGGEEFKTKSLLRFSCEAGYNLIGSAERTCLHNGTWSGTQPVCQGGEACQCDICGYIQNLLCKKIQKI